MQQEGEVMKGSKRSIKKSWRRGRGPGSLRAEMKKSIKANKRYLKRKFRNEADLPNGNAYRRLAKEKQYEYVT